MIELDLASFAKTQEEWQGIIYDLHVAYAKKYGRDEHLLLLEETKQRVARFGAAQLAMKMLAEYEGPEAA